MKDTTNRVNEHVEEVRQMFPDNKIVGVFLQGSQNYQLDIDGSDVDTKCVLVPSFYDVAMNKKPKSTTHVRENNEHIDLKDVRLTLQIFRKQNVNFIEILFTPYYTMNPLYQEEWNRLREANERIARLNPYAAVKTMRGVAYEKFHAMEHPYPSKIAILEKYGYDAKQLHHLVRIEEFLLRYIAGEPYKDCLVPRNKEYFKAIKLNYYTLEEARKLSKITMDSVTRAADCFFNSHESKEDQEVVGLLNDVQYNIMRIATEWEFNHEKSVL